MPESETIASAIHLQLVVIIEAQRLIDTDTRIQLDSAFFQTMLASGVAGVQDGHIVLFCQSIDGGEQAQEVLLRVCIFLNTLIFILQLGFSHTFTKSHSQFSLRGQSFELQ